MLGSNPSSIMPKSAASSVGFLGGTLGDILPGSEALLGTTIPSYGLLIAAATNDQRLDVLAEPHILTIDNKPAKISVGENVPYRTSTDALTATGATLPGGIGRQPIALTLSITPHVAPAPPEITGVDREVALDIDLQDSEMIPDQSSDLGPTWKDRSLTTSVVLHDEETLVLGGIVDERTTDTVTKVPFLGDIPLLGYLFKQTEKKREKTNLLVLITPHVLADTEDGREILARRMRERDEFVRASRDFERRVWEPAVNPRKMRGLVADIDANVREVERERAELDLAARPKGFTPGPVDPAANDPATNDPPPTEPPTNDPPTPDPPTPPEPATPP
jgi:general secretion pathway protein D